MSEVPLYSLVDMLGVRFNTMAPAWDAVATEVLRV